MTDNLRLCKYCGSEKDIEKFNLTFSKKYPTNRRRICKECEIIKNKFYYLKRKSLKDISH